MFSDRGQPIFLPIRLPGGLRWFALAWIAAEIVTFMLLVHAIGLGATILLGIVTTVMGIAALRRVGFGAFQGLRRAAEQGTAAPGDGLADGLLSGFAAVMLIIPGFLANAVGLALCAPSLRRGLLRRFGTGATGAMPPRPARPGVIDLAPGEWTPVDRV